MTFIQTDQSLRKSHAIFIAMLFMGMSKIGQGQADQSSEQIQYAYSDTGLSAQNRILTTFYQTPEGGCLIAMIEYFNPTSEGTWYGYKHVQYYYDEELILLYYIERLKNTEGEWTDNKKTTFDYDGLGRLVRENVYKIYSYGWNLDTYYRYQYNESGLRTLKVNYSYLPTQGFGWYESYKNIYTYDSTNRLIKNFGYFKAVYNWSNHFQNNYTYYGDTLVVDTALHYSSGWINYAVTDKHYDDGALTEEVYQDWNNNLWELNVRKLWQNNEIEGHAESMDSYTYSNGQWLQDQYYTFSPPCDSVIPFIPIQHVGSLNIENKKPESLLISNPGIALTIDMHSMQTPFIYLTIYDSSGRVLVDAIYITSDRREIFQPTLPELPHGVYIVQVRTMDAVKLDRWVKGG